VTAAVQAFDNYTDSETVIDLEERLEMTRPTRLKILYGAAVVLLIAVALAILKATNFSPTIVVLLALLFLIPGRINGHFWRGFYTRDVEAMTQNNIGAVLIREGNLDQAEYRLAQAIQIDDQYPIPYYNMALLGELRGEREAAVRSLSTAQSLGYRQTNIDEIANKAASILAIVEGRKKKPSGDDLRAVPTGRNWPTAAVARNSNG